MKTLATLFQLSFLLLVFPPDNLLANIGDNNSNERTFRSYEVNVHGITYRIDPRIELFNIVAMQFGHSGMTLSNIPYKKESLDYFDAYKNHPAPKILMETWQKGWHVDDPMFFLLFLDKNFQIKNGLHPDLIERGGGLDQLKKLAGSLKEYAEQAGFYHYFNEVQRDFYDQVLSQTAYNFKDFAAVELLEGFYGEQAHSYTLILNLMGGYGNFGRSIRNEDGLNLYAIVESGKSSGELPVFMPSVSGMNLILHEFSHGFVNPEVDKYAEELSDYEHLYLPIEAAMKSQAYHHWHVTVNEHIVRSSVILMVEQLYNKPFADVMFYRSEVGKRFIYADMLLEKLRYYNQNRELYPSFAEFVPELVAAFSEVDEEYISQKQQKVEGVRYPDIDSLPKPYSFSKDSSTVFVVGTHEANSEHQQVMHDWVKEYRGMLSQDIQIITDEEALNRDLSQNALVLFGTPEGNKFLAKYIHQLPVIITDKYIVTNKVVEGSDLQLVTSWVNPFNNNRPMVIYTAQKTQDVQKYQYSAVRDQYHYWVAQDLITLDKGDYENYYKIWMPNIF